MKKIILSLFIYSSLATNAQGIEHGFVSGSSFSWMKTKETNSAQTSVSGPRRTTIVGWYLHYFVSRNLAVQPELMLTNYGGVLINSEIRLGYIALAVPAQLNITPGLYGLAGPQVAMLIKAKYKDTYTKMYFACLLGAGYSFRETGLDAGIRYVLGLSDIHAAVGKATQMNAFQLVLTGRIGSIKWRPKRS